MSSMYETIMELPLFKGIGTEQLSQMLEKTSMEFLKFNEGDIIEKIDIKVNAIDFILSGKVRQIHQLQNFKISIEEILGEGNIIGGLNLFGMNTTHESTSVAEGKVGIMRLEKSQYMNVLQSDRIYLLNFVNYLSAAAQKAPSMFLKTRENSIGRFLETMVYSLCSKRAEIVMLAGTDEEFARLCGVSESDFISWKMSEQRYNRILLNERGLILKSPDLINKE